MAFFQKDIPMFDDLLARQDDIRQQLFQIMRKKKISMRALSQELDISPVTLQRFLQARQSHYITLLKIEEYIQEQK
jgi:lambda repressor-like predicted transcriptional regulator